MKTLMILASLILLTNCAGGGISKISLGKKCTEADAKQLQESSYVWFVSSDAVSNFDKRINKKNCLDS
jgi:uroporphyrinogen-III synthase